MARPKKNGTYLNVCIETPIYERLENFCKDAGHTKTVAVIFAPIQIGNRVEAEVIVEMPPVKVGDNDYLVLVAPHFPRKF